MNQKPSFMEDSGPLGPNTFGEEHEADRSRIMWNNGKGNLLGV